MERGYVKLWRKVLDSGILSNGDVSHLFLYLLAKASWRKHNLIVGKQNVELLPGQVVFGRIKASSDLNMSEWRIRTALVLLEKMGVISAPKTTSKFSVISFVNWSVYQSDTKENHQQLAPIPAIKPPADHHKQEVIEVKEVTTTPTLPGVCDDTPPVAVKVKRGGRPKKDTDPDVGELTKLFSELYTSKTNLPFTKYGAIGKILTRFKKDFLKENIEFIMRHYFADDNNFMAGKNFTPAGFSNAFDCIAQKAQRGEI